MTNAEKYLKEGVDVEFVDEFEQFCAKQTGNQASSVRLIQFLSRAVTPTLTEDERVILRNIDKGYKKIGRYGGKICVFYIDDIHEELDAFNHLFKFIKERRRI